MLNYKKQLQEAEELIHLQIEQTALVFEQCFLNSLNRLDFLLWKQNLKLEIINLKIWK